jgi:hypothetical protein
LLKGIAHGAPMVSGFSGNMDRVRAQPGGR